MTKLKIALALAARGFKVFPIKAGVKAPPLVAEWPDKATTDAETIRDWWSTTPDANTGIHCAGLVVVDVDARKGGDVSLAALDMIYEVPATLTTRTPTGGRHLFFRLPEGHPGVANSVQLLGKGLDIRSTKGYAVAPGSEVEAGRYHFEADVPIADAPEWLLPKLGSYLPKSGTTPAPVADAPEGAVVSAATWLAVQDGAVEGQGGDVRTYQVACRLRDFGLSASQAFELMQDWNVRCSPPWSTDALWRKVDNAYRYAQEEHAGKAAPSVAADFTAPSMPVCSEAEMQSLVASSGLKAHLNVLPVGVAPYAGPPGSTKRNRPQRLDDFAAETAALPGYLIKGVLSRQAYAVMYGVPGAGKSFTALDMAYHVAAGEPWMDKRVKAGTVLYLAYEGAGGMRKRAQALQKHYGTSAVPFYIQAARYNIRTLEGRQELGAAIAELPEKPALIVFDTFAHALCGGDENSAQDVGAFNAGIGSLIEATGACVLVLHHPAKSGNSGPRGSGALVGAVDIEIEVADRTIYSRKQRDFELAEPIGFKLLPLQVGIDEDGDAITSCVVLPSQIQPRSMRGLKDGSNQKRAFEVLCDIRPTNEPVTSAEWLAACSEFVNSKGRWYDVRARLKRLNLITIDAEGHIRRRLE